MTGDEILDAMEHIDPDLIADADAPTKKRRKPYWFAAVAALLVLAVGIGSIFGGNGIPGTTGPIQIGFPTTAPTETTLPNFVLTRPISPDTLQLANLLYAAQYPEIPEYPVKEHIHGDRLDDEVWFSWRAYVSQWRKEFALTNKETQNLNAFFLQSTREFLSGEGNQAYSPLSVYISLSALAECSAGNTRKEILKLLGADSIESLRSQTHKIWNAHYFSDGNTSCLLANSIWLDRACSLSNETAQNLIDHYYTSVFYGDLGTADMNNQLRQWLNSQTGGFLNSQSKELQLHDDTVFYIASTLIFNSKWKNFFSQKDNTIKIFHGINDTYSTEFMNDTFIDTFFQSDTFAAVKLSLNGPAAGYMWFFLPNENLTPQDILQSDTWLLCTQSLNDGVIPDSLEQFTERIIHLSLPKFDISTQNNLKNGMQKMGLGTIFDPNASNFSTLCKEMPVYVNQIDHAVRVAIDEEGITASAYIVSSGGIGGNPSGEEVDFILDRPFLFVITSRDGLPLFTGIVNEP